MNTKLGAWLTVNRGCNLRCSWCYARPTNYEGQDMSLGLARKLIRFLNEIGTDRAILIGGEPTVYPHLITVIKEFIDAGITPSLVTNGVRFANKQFATRVVDAGLKSISISVKGASPSMYKASTGADVYDRVLNGYENLATLETSVDLSITLVNDIIPEMDRLFSDLIARGVKRLSIDMATPVVTEKGISMEGIPDLQELADAIVRADELLLDTDVDYAFMVSIPLCLIPEEKKKDMVSRGRILTCCHVQKASGLIFDQDGKVLPCNHFPLYPMAQFGVEFSDAESFWDFWNSESVRKYRDLAISYPSSICQSCTDWSRCGGGCFVKWLYFDPQSYIPQRR